MRGDAFEFTSLLVQHARYRARVGLAVSGAQAFDGLGQRIVATRAVEQALERFLLRVGPGVRFDYMSGAGAAGDVVRQRL